MKDGYWIWLCGMRVGSREIQLAKKDDVQKQSTKKYLIIVVAVFAITTIFFTISYVRTKKSIENFNTALGKDEKVNFFQVIQTIQNDNKFGTTEEQIRFAAIAPNKGIIEIREKMFLAQVNDVYLNSEDYLGKQLNLKEFSRLSNIMTMQNLIVLLSATALVVVVITVMPVLR
jgi:hypothetical protein